ncbi:somatoliberin [Pogoniulus pusillus]|uniref:somatoliberin n=1 Tax=Pogoniulus pusillus TaxID=488313 RepID=UPI0030B98131
MLDKATLLLFLHLVACSISSPLYPALRYSPGMAAGKAVNFQLQHSSPLQSHDLSAEEQEEKSLLTGPTEKRRFSAGPGAQLVPASPRRTQRHADAIFTDNYRKFLGQISARKFLQTIIGKRLGSGSSPGEGMQELLTRRQSDSILMDSRYHQQMVLRDFLGAILQRQRPQDLKSSQLEGFPSTLVKLM